MRHQRARSLVLAAGDGRREGVFVMQSAKNRIGADGMVIHKRTFLALIVCILAACQHVQTLPHRHTQELFPQANSPSKECPGQYPDYVITHDGTAMFFLECWGDTNTLKVNSYE